MFTDKSKFSFLSIILLFLTACTHEPCIDADDFGQFTSIKVFSNYLDAKNPYNEHYSYQSPPWQDNNLILNGSDLVINVYVSQNLSNSEKINHLICDWYENTNSTSSSSTYCQLLNTCEKKLNSFSINKHCQSLDLCSNTSDKSIPCVYDGGEFLDMAEEYDNTLKILHFTLDTDKRTYSASDQVGDRVQKDPFTITVSANKLQQGAKLLFRIKNNFNTDNSGSYTLKIKSGVDNITSITSKGFFDSIISSIKNVLISEGHVVTDGQDLCKNYSNLDMNQGLVNKIYMTFLCNSSFTNIVKLTLILYVIFLGFAFLIGQSHFTSQELFFHLIKIIFVSFLLDASSWNFFYSYFFKFFIYGSDQLISLVKNMSNSDLGVDQSIISLLFSGVVRKKIFSLFFVYLFPLGLVYFALIYIIFFFACLVIIEVSINYITHFVMMIIVIALFPIMLIFLLFSITRSLFDNWLNGLIAYFIKPILLYAGVFFFISMIGDEVYKMLGFRVCKKSILFGLIRYWYPDPYVSEDFTKNTVDMIIPIAHYKRDEDGQLLKDFESNSNYCEAFECTGERYPDLPLLDPNNIFDKFRIEYFQNEKFLHWQALMWMVIYLLLCGAFLKVIDEIANFISSSRTPNSTETVSVPIKGKKIRLGTLTKQILSPGNLLSQGWKVTKFTIRSPKKIANLYKTTANTLKNANLNNIKLRIQNSLSNLKTGMYKLTVGNAKTQISDLKSKIQNFKSEVKNNLNKEVSTKLNRLQSAVTKLDDLTKNLKNNNQKLNKNFKNTLNKLNNEFTELFRTIKGKNNNIQPNNSTKPTIEKPNLSIHTSKNSISPNIDDKKSSFRPDASIKPTTDDKKNPK